MDPLENLILQVWPLAGVLALFVGLPALGWWMRRGQARRLDAQRTHNATQAARLGLQYAPPGTLAPGDAGDAAAHRYTGTTDGVAWVIEASLLADQHIVSQLARGECQRGFTRWSCAQAGTGGGYLMLMNLQGNAGAATATTRPPRGEHGLMAGIARLADRAAEAALQAYARMSFGMEGPALGALKPAHHLPLGDSTFESAFRAFSDTPALRERCGPQAREALLREHPAEVALWWNESGLMLRWPGSRLSPAQIAAHAQFGATLVHLLRATTPASVGDGSMNSTRRSP